ncbi:hypothetical protein BVRB_8g189240 [Beta vulgaris subsp. vulgaris]|nr:hypothetical protein BVRB_8g189240 [Beta vulgaris subsp. vulgaris]
MADFVQKNSKKQHQDIVQHLENHKTSSSLRNAHEKAEQILQRNATTVPQKLPILAKEHHSPMSQKKQKHKAFCKPGSMSAYREFRKEQLENKEQNNDLEASMINESAMVMTNPSTLSRVDEDENAMEDENAHEFEVPEDTEIEAPRNKKHRGPTKLPKVHARTTEERKVIILNSVGQPVGPTQETVDEFSLFLGTVARDPELAPLNYRHFPSLTTRDKM